ncbi:MAG: peptidoglycan DD-metalloendopeptidase family protein [Candidatus Latescibacterota bacterium]|nr:peptidoglycan DD-metalloendopeptidase family protein [Candidatus Latescibacterota bacterium]
MTGPQRVDMLFWALLASLVALVALRQGLLLNSPRKGVADAALLASQAPPAIVIPVAEPELSASTLVPVQADSSVHRSYSDTLDSDDSIYLKLKRRGMSELQIALLNQALLPIFDPARSVRSGDRFSVRVDSSDALIDFRYIRQHKPDKPIVVDRVNDELHARQVVLPVSRRTATVQVVIEDNLANVIDSAGEGDRLTDIIADDIFGAVIDFQKDPRRGDRVSLVFTKEYLDGQFLRYDRVLLASYEGRVVSRHAVYYENPNGEGGYYDNNGASLERLFLLKPLSFRRISSRFNRKRFHPILKRNVPHLGTDYAANHGTEVWATARGLVTMAGRNGGYGKMVEIEHPNGYRSRYAHLSRIRVRKGQHVKQQQIIGHVGATGRATGPHLHYELIQNGRHINPSSVNSRGEGEPLAVHYRDAFYVKRDQLLALLRPRELAGVEVARSP